MQRMNLACQSINSSCGKKCLCFKEKNGVVFRRIYAALHMSNAWFAASSAQVYVLPDLHADLFSRHARPLE